MFKDRDRVVNAQGLWPLAARNTLCGDKATLALPARDNGGVLQCVRVGRAEWQDETEEAPIDGDE